jgi:DNA-binding response OmpR family regulator
MSTGGEAPDIVVLSSEWRSRVALRAQLVEEGYQVRAVDTWTDARRWLRADARPRLVIVDLQALADPRRVLEDLRALMRPDCILVLAALGTVPSTEIRELGLRLASRPIDIGSIVAMVRTLLDRPASQDTVGRELDPHSTQTPPPEPRR